MSYPLGYDPSGLQPIVTIKDMDGNVRYRFESAGLVDGEPRQDFDLASWNIHMGVNTDHGQATIGIDDRGDNLVDKTTTNRRLKIKNDWELVIELGKHKDNIQTWFSGIIEQPELTNPGANMQTLAIMAIGWGVITSHSYVNIQAHQAKLPDNLVDSTDDSTKLSEIFKSIITSAGNYIIESINNGITIDDGLIQDINIRFPEFVRKYETAGAILSELAHISGSIYGIDPDKKAYLRLHGSKSSGFLISNEINPLTKQVRNWDQDKILYLKNQPFNYKESTIDSGYTTVHGLAAIHLTDAYSQLDANALIDLSASPVAFPFTVERNVASIQFIISKLNHAADTAGSLRCSIFPATSATTYDDDTLLASFIISAERINRLLPEARVKAFVEQQIDRTSIPQGGTYWLRIEQFEDSTNPVRLDYETGSGVYHAPGLLTGSITTLVKSAIDVNILAQNTQARRRSRNKETIFQFSSFPTQESIIASLEGIMDLYGSIRRIYDPIMTETPADRPPLGTTIKIKNKINGLDIDAELIGYDISGSAFDADSNLGANTMSIHVEEWL